MSDNIVGLRVTEQEYDFVSKGLNALADQANKAGQAHIANHLRHFVQRLKQAVFVGNGIPKETMQGLTDELGSALHGTDFDKVRKVMSTIVAAAVRMEPDPGNAVGHIVGPFAAQMMHQWAMGQGGQIAAGTLRHFSRRLKKERKAFEKNGWSDPAATFDYLHELTKYCASELENGIDPFADLGDEGDEDEDAEDSSDEGPAPH